MQITGQQERVIALLEVIATRSFNSEESHQLRGLVYLFCRQKVRDQSGRSFLHFAVMNRYSRRASSAVTRLLIECGHDIDCADNYGDTPLHFAATIQVGNASEIIDILVDSGAHLDYANKNGETPLNRCLSGRAKVALLRHSMPRLLCLAARVVARSGLEFAAHIPVSLHVFVSRH